MNKLDTNYKNTWCPGCGNFGILMAFKNAIKDEDPNNIAIVSGIGCHAKIVDYINVNSFYSLHGRALPAAEGIKLANPDLKVITHEPDVANRCKRRLFIRDGQLFTKANYSV